MSLDRSRRGAQMEPLVTTSMAERTVSGPAGPGNDRIEDQFVVALRADHNQLEGGTGAANVLQYLQPAGGRMQVHHQILDRWAGQQLVDAAWNRKQRGLLLMRRLLKDTGEPLEPDGFIGYQAYVDWFLTANRRHFALPQVSRRTGPCAGEEALSPPRRAHLLRSSRQAIGALGIPYSLRSAIPCCFWYLPLRSA